ncbi:MAG: transposase [Bacteroidota bacterium]
MSARRSNMKISPFGGAVPILKKIKDFGIPQLIRSTLGTRKKQAQYGYEDGLIAWVLTSLCGGTRLDHVTKLKKKLSIIPGLKLPSHDTLGRVMKKLATATVAASTVSSKKKVRVTHADYNDNIPMNRMLIKATKRAGALKEGPAYTLDIDATFIATECRGAIRKLDSTGKIEGAKIGFNPMVCLIGDLPVFISMRNGNAAPSFQIKQCLENCLNLLEESKIRIGRVISDAAGYNKEVFEMLDAKGIKFNVRFPFQRKMETFKVELKKCNTWRKTQIETANFFWDCEIADIPYKMFDLPVEKRVSKTWRVVAMRIPTSQTQKKIDTGEWERKNSINEKMKNLSAKKMLKEPGKTYKDIHWKEIDGYLYKFFITNDEDKTSEEIILEYNKRGNAERKFSFLKQDFGWRLPPFMNMNENAVFMIAAALANNIFRAMVILFKKDVPQLRLNARLREFQYIFINVSCAYINDQFVFYEEDILYEKLMDGT